MQLSNAENDLSEQLKELCVSADVLACWKEEIYQAAQSKILVIPKPINTAALQYLKPLTYFSPINVVYNS